MNLGDKNILTLEQSGIDPLDVSFIPDEFRSTIETQGYDVVYEEAIDCPCRDQSSGSAQTTCKNCGGSGLLFMNPTQMRMILTSISKNQEYDETGMKDYGMMYGTPVALIRLGKMDKITVLDGLADQNEVLELEKDEEDTGSFFGFTHYNIQQVRYVGLYQGIDSKIKRLIPEQDYQVNNNIIILSEEFDKLSHPRITIRYAHRPVFHVWDIVNEIRSVKIEKGGRKISMPMRAALKRSHLIKEVEDFDGTRLFNNSWKAQMSNDCNIKELSEFDRLVRSASANKLFNSLTSLQRVKLKPLFERVLAESLTLSITIQQPTINIV